MLLLYIYDVVMMYSCILRNLRMERMYTRTGKSEKLGSPVSHVILT